MAFEDVEEHRSSGLDSHEFVQNGSADSPADLYGELQNTAARFKQLADMLQKTASRKDLTNDKGVQTNGCCEETRTELLECIAENLRLRQNLKDVSDINHRWQNYNYDRQKHVQHLLSTMSELRSTIDTMKQQSSDSPAVFPKESDKNKSDGESQEELGRTVDVTKRQTRKSPVPRRESETSESSNQCVSLNDKLLREIRVLSRQLKDARNESKTLKQQMEKVVEENDTLRSLLKTYRSDWEEENREKTEALSQAQRVVQELCALKVNCQMQAEKLMKMCTVSFNCSLCQGTQSRHTLNNLNLNTKLECNAKDGNRDRHRKVTRTAAAITHNVGDIEVHLQERCSGVNGEKRKSNIGSLKVSSENQLTDSTGPIVTFPDSDSDEHTTNTVGKREPTTQFETSQHLICPVCFTPFEKRHGSQFLDHYTVCKLSPGKLVS